MLQAYLIGGQPIGTVVITWETSQLNGNPPFIVNTVLQPGYADISSITSWDNFGIVTGKDFRYIRYQIQLIVTATGYANLSLSEKILANKYFVSGVEYFNAEVTPAEQNLFFSDFLKPNSDTARKQRDLAVTGWIVQKLYTGLLAQAVIDTLIEDAAELRTQYIRDGRQGIGYNDTIEGVINFVKNDNGFSPFPIVAVNTVTKIFSVAGDKTSSTPAGKIIRIHASTGNNGPYTVVSSVYDATNTNIVVAENIPDATADGNMYTKGLLWYAGLTTAYQDQIFDIYWNGNY
jgi:hypothetical protein